MEYIDQLTFQFISQPTDVNFGGKVHGGAVMKWMDQTAYACATAWTQTYCVTIYVGGIKFYKPIKIGDLIKINAQVIYTGNTSIHIGLDVYSRNIIETTFQKTTHCIMVFVSVDKEGNSLPVKKWIPQSPEQVQMELYAIKMMNMRKQIETEMVEYLER
jgi:acyl-CoA hydrolase